MSLRANFEYFLDIFYNIEIRALCMEELISCSNFYWLVQLKHDTMHCTPEISNSNLKSVWQLMAKYCHLLLKYIFQFSYFSLQEPVCPHHNKKYIPEHHWCMAICFPVIAETHTIGTHPLIRSSPDINFMVLIKDNINLVTKINWRPLILYIECNFLRQNPGLFSRFTGEIVIFLLMTWCLYQY